MSNKAAIEKIEQSLLGIIAAITQNDGKNLKRDIISKIAIAKGAGAATVTSIFGLVSTFGAAGTGTAIGSLSGAAATNATLAWIGGLAGGGMAAGAILLPTFGLFGGVAASRYIFPKIFSRKKTVEDLLEFEQEILFSTHNLLRPLQPPTNIESLQSNDFRIYIHEGLYPLLVKIDQYFDFSNKLPKPEKEAAHFRNTLNSKHQKALLNHCRVLTGFVRKYSKIDRNTERRKKPSWLRRFWNRLTSKEEVSKTRANSAAVVLAVTFQRLLEDKLTNWRLEESLVLDALRRSTNRLNTASVEELSDYVRNLSPEQIKGVASNTKGIYHELLFTETHNTSGSDTEARIMEATNHPGADVQFYRDGDLISEVQLKAVSSPTLVYEHLERYPDTEILVTEEMAAVIDGIESSGFSNVFLNHDVAERLYELKGEGFFDEVTDAMMTSAFVTTSILVCRTLTKKSSEKIDYTSYLTNAGIAVGTGGIWDAVESIFGN